MIKRLYIINVKRPKQIHSPTLFQHQSVCPDVSFVSNVTHATLQFNFFLDLIFIRLSSYMYDTELGNGP